MSPKEKVYITELEAALLQVFMQFGQFNDSEIANDLELLVKKLRLKLNEKIS